MRATRRAVTLGLLLVYCLFRSLLSRLTGPDTPARRAQWNHSSAKLVLAALRIRLKITGNPPSRGLLVSNHLSYLEVLVYGAALPCYLVSKAEIARWPFFGTLARAGGTLFVDRASRASAIQVSNEIAERLKGDVPVLFFPEGTSTDGTLLRFRSRLFTPAVEAGVPVTAAAVRYVPEDGSPERDFCWFGDAEFLPHLLKALGGPNVSAEVHFGEPHIYTDRRTAADATRVEVAAMRNAGAPIQPSELLMPAIVE
ncbi:MAG: lysophospholipid acyltransferase family protein [Terracidiphilus sp.]|jgi:1-acyl-sn-glycerol-3-phosphate acyltransferase